ncbi:E3 ubiquitin-protein ligase ATL23-like [Aristolochia californica]|uniref:E3 ubiquitin-protein ligase ATL23-like n=1 Tax=Aristolochia californica TaxID=171875 RepID=UPI0035E0C9B2
MLILGILVAVALPFLGTCAVFAVYMCLVLYATRRSRVEATDQKTASKGLSKSELEKLPVIDDAEEGWECIVCLENVDKGQKARVLPICKHFFHVHCADQWLARNPVCPVCRTSLQAPTPPQIIGDNNC